MLSLQERFYKKYHRDANLVTLETLLFSGNLTSKLPNAREVRPFLLAFPARRAEIARATAAAIAVKTKPYSLIDLRILRIRFPEPEFRRAMLLGFFEAHRDSSGESILTISNGAELAVLFPQFMREIATEIGMEGSMLPLQIAAVKLALIAKFPATDLIQEMQHYFAPEAFRLTEEGNAILPELVMIAQKIVDGEAVTEEDWVLAERRINEKFAEEMGEAEYILDLDYLTDPDPLTVSARLPAPPSAALAPVVAAVVPGTSFFARSLTGCGANGGGAPEVKRGTPERELSTIPEESEREEADDSRESHVSGAASSDSIDQKEETAQEKSAPTRRPSSI